MGWSVLVQESNCGAKYGKKWPRRAGTHALSPCPMSVSICPPFFAQPCPSLPQLRPLALKALNLHPGHAGSGKLASPIVGRPRVRQGFSYLNLCPCPFTADALQTHNTVFQEHAAPSSPGTASTSRGFRRASEISIASQVSGMAENYTASSIAQSEC